MKFIVRALGSRNYRLFYFGQGISLIGTWMQRIAISWLVYRLTNSAMLLGIVGFAGSIPNFVLAPYAGVWVDRLDRRRLLLWTQVLAMLQAIILAILVLTGTVEWWHVLILSLVLGLVNVMDIPARQSFVIEMLEKREDLSNAIALNSSLVNIARLIGPSIAGLLIATVGEGVCFSLNALSFCGSIAALSMMRFKPKSVTPRKTHQLDDLKEGVRYVFRFVPIRSVILLLAIISLMGMPYQVLLPIFARDILHGDSRILGFLMASAGLGALTGAFYLASRRDVRGTMRITGLAALIFGLGLVLFSHSGTLSLSLVLIYFCGMGMMLGYASSNTILQSIVDDDKRGRVMAFYAMAIMGMSPFGSLIYGSLAGLIGTPNTIMVGGLSCIIGGGLFLSKLKSNNELIKPLLEKNGMTGVQN